MTPDLSLPYCGGCVKQATYQARRTQSGIFPCGIEPHFPERESFSQIHTQTGTNFPSGKDSATGIRTPVPAVKGRCPRPLDDSTASPINPETAGSFNSPFDVPAADWIG
jgi:hypothetical protein